MGVRAERRAVVEGRQPTTQATPAVALELPGPSPPNPSRHHQLPRPFVLHHPSCGSHPLSPAPPFPGRRAGKPMLLPCGICLVSDIAGTDGGRGRAGNGGSVGGCGWMAQQACRSRRRRNLFNDRNSAFPAVPLDFGGGEGTRRGQLWVGPPSHSAPLSQHREPRAACPTRESGPPTNSWAAAELRHAAAALEPLAGAALAGLPAQNISGEPWLAAPCVRATCQPPVRTGWQQGWGKEEEGAGGMAQGPRLLLLLLPTPGAASGGPLGGERAPGAGWWLPRCRSG